MHMQLFYGMGMKYATYFWVVLGKYWHFAIIVKLFPNKKIENVKICKNYAFTNSGACSRLCQ